MQVRLMIALSTRQGVKAPKPLGNFFAQTPDSRGLQKDVSKSSSIVALLGAHRAAVPYSVLIITSSLLNCSSTFTSNAIWKTLCAVKIRRSNSFGTAGCNNYQKKNSPITEKEPHQRTYHYLLNNYFRTSQI